MTYIIALDKPPKNNRSQIKDGHIPASLKSSRMARRPIRSILTGMPRIEKGWTRSETDGSVGSGGEIREFHIDFNFYTKCLLPRNKPFYVKKYYLAKGDKLDFEMDALDLEENAIAYIATSNRNRLDTNDSPDNVAWNGYLAVRRCGEGKFQETNSMKVADHGEIEGNLRSARQCGLATTLSYLCYLDREHEPSIQGKSGLFNYDFELEYREVTTAKELERLERFIKVILKDCKLILKVISASRPSAGGRAYIYAGMDAGYQYLMTIGKDRTSPFGTDAVAHHMDKLNRLFEDNPVRINGDEIIDPVLDELIEKEGNRWYFCKI